MQNENIVLENAEVVGVKIKSIKKLDGKRDVYCLGTEKNGTMIANGIIVANCDALRYAVFTHKPNTFDQEAHNKNIEQQLRMKYHPQGYGYRGI